MDQRGNSGYENSGAEYGARQTRNQARRSGECREAAELANYEEKEK